MNRVDLAVAADIDVLTAGVELAVGKIGKRIFYPDDLSFNTADN